MHHLDEAAIKAIFVRTLGCLSFTTFDFRVVVIGHVEVYTVLNIKQT